MFIFMHLWLRLGIIQVNLASALALHKRSICKAKIRPNGNIGKLMSVFLLACPPRDDARKPFLARVYAKNTPKNYTYPALTDLIA